MEVAADIECPWCGQVMTVMVDTGVPRQEWIVDCEVCCRPMVLTAACEPGEILSLEAAAG